MSGFDLRFEASGGLRFGIGLGLGWFRGVGAPRVLGGYMAMCCEAQISLHQKRLPSGTAHA